MGSRSSRPKPIIRPRKMQKKTRIEYRRRYGSTQSVNVNDNSVYFSPDPSSPNAYSQPERPHALPRYHSSEDVSSQERSASPPRPVPRHSRPHNQRHRTKTQPQFQTFEDTPRQANPGNPPIPPRNKPLLVPNNKETLTGRKDSTEDEGHYLEVNKGSRPKLRADRNYESNHGNDISFRKGDILQLLTDECLFMELDRDEAEEKLLEPNVEHGTYLLRPGAEDYILSLRCQTEFYELEIRHYKLKVAQEGICYLEIESNRKPFRNITELIKYYSEKPGLRCKLKKPFLHDVRLDVPLNDLAVKFSDLKLGVELGSGNFGYVFAGTLHDNKQVAVKSLKAGGSMTVEEFRKEAETMHKLRHQNLVCLLAICEENGTIHIITERMSRGSLQNLLRQDSSNTITFKDLMCMAIQVIDGMCYLERKRFIHRDLRAANVLVGDGNITKIADFGLARLLDRYYKHEFLYLGKKDSELPLRWTAPEAINQLKFTVKSDVWSFGILLYEMVTYGDRPYAAMSNHEVLDWVLKGNRLEKPMDHYCPVTLYNIMKQCWMKHTEDRPNFSDIKETLLEIKAHRSDLQ